VLEFALIDLTHSRTMQIFAWEVTELMREVAVVTSVTVSGQSKLAELVLFLRLRFSLEVLLSLMLSALFLINTIIGKVVIALLLLELSWS
jgi:hypothetical protein